MKNEITISAGNRKMGAIPSVSLPAVVTCPKSAPCYKECYALRMERLRHTVKDSYDRNYDAYKRDPDNYFRTIANAARMQRFFRWHVSGDIPDSAYLAGMVKVAIDCPGTKFLAFTKKGDLVNAFIENGGTIPGNLQILFSTWGAWRVNNPHAFPECEIIFPGHEPAQTWKVCGGNCTECACRGIGCWELHRGETIAIYKH